LIISDEIKRRLWDGANELRGSMDASRYKDYMLGLMFYKFLSDKTLEQFRISAGLTQSSPKELLQEYRKAYEKYGEQLIKMLHSALGYYVLPEYLYQTWLEDIDSGDFELQKVTDSLNNFERTIAVTGDLQDFKGLFSTSTIDLTDTALGSNLNERSKNIRELIKLFADLNMVVLQKSDVLGDAYEYLIGQFAMESGKKAGEFYTPKQVSEVMAQIVAKSGKIRSIYDPTVGSGSLLLTVGKHMSENDRKMLHYYGQERNTATYNLTRMNLLLHGVRPERMTVRNGDTLAEDWPEDPERPNEGVLFDAVVMNPPYSVKNWNRKDLKVSDPRFEIAGVLPPNSRGDYAFLLHGLYHLGPQGTMAIVLPHGVLFRGGTEGEIRKRLLDRDLIDTVIGLPEKLFTNTGIPVCVIILKKNRDLKDPVLMIDASREFAKEGRQNVLQEKDIAKIVDTYIERRVEPGYSYLAAKETIIQNDYNLNIPRYVEAIEQDIPHDVDAHLYGGIPRHDLKRLKVLQSTAKEIVEEALREIRPNYSELTKPIAELKKDLLQSEGVLRKAKILKEKINAYTAKYWEILKNVDDDILDLKEDMLAEIKEILKEFKHVNVYDGYQVIAKIWKKCLKEDTEIIASTKNFYQAARERVPNIVIKGSGKNRREEQDGWNSLIVPNDLIKKHLFSKELNEIENKQQRVQEVEAELDELVEAAKIEESDENFALGECLNKNETAFTVGAVRNELKSAEEGTEEYSLLQKVESLLTERTTLNRECKELEKELKEATEARIENLTQEEIDFLIFEKWFGDLTTQMISLIEQPLKEDLKTLEMLQTRYQDTLDSLEKESEKLEQELEAMLQEMVVTTP
jgi:type I restriction enzyme M protein